MDIQDYLVTLGVRPAELRGLKELPGGTKDRLRPLLLLAPWLATSPLSRALKKFEDAYASRPYFVDVDTYYRVNDNLNESKNLWARLASRPADVEAWWQLLEDFPHANPCLLLADQPIERVRQQIGWARERGRTFCIRMNFSAPSGPGIPSWMPALMEELAAEGANDYAVVFEFGWVVDPLGVAAIASGYTQTFFSNIPADVPVAVSCTSFPNDFTPYDGLTEVPFSNRDLMAKVQRSTNHPKIIYGDWGSTRPRSYGHASQTKNRIDFPTDRSWLFARDHDESVSLQEAARRVVASNRWSGELGIWGEQLIEGTAAGQNFAIDTMAQMYSVRINIHLHRQAFYNDLPPPASLDEEWSDDL
ncbi:MAG: hypothetical protein EOO77_28040 [Oxalobacteraceae bacterium]|nr:MAG: hypothetical protein EOO77_28040 [Oxalobacteraceae bacterium]